MKYDPLSLHLADALEAADVYLPLDTKDTAKLKEYLPDGEQVYLTITDGTWKEYVLAENKAGTVVLKRGVDSEARKFPRGSCVVAELSIPLVKWLICNYECCDGDCPVDAVAAAGAVIPNGTVGNSWEGFFVFSGTLPIAVGVTGAPSWMSTESGPNYVRMHGTPTAAGTFTVSAAGTNQGGNVVVQQGTFTVS